MSQLKNWVKQFLYRLSPDGTLYHQWVYRPSLRMSIWNAGYRLGGVSDGLPIPPTHLIYLATNSKHIAWFLRGGNICKDSIQYSLKKNDIFLENFTSVLDFGCGCGRVLRHWRGPKGVEFYGSDYNPVLIRWCNKKLGHIAKFSQNRIEPPLDYDDAFFDFIYTISVFTHLPSELQHAWIHELTRILRPGGFLLLSVHGESRIYDLNPAERHQFQQGQLIVKQEADAGSNYCSTYQSDRNVRELAKGLEFVDFIPLGARDADQDFYLFKKPQQIH